MADVKSKSMSLDERKALVARLVKQFRENEKFYTSKDFVEAEVRSKFIDPFLEALAWDVKNEKGARHDRQEVITEDRVIISGQVKHPDYTLCYGGERKIYVEAKQPSVDLKKDPEPALQVRRYAYTSKMPIAILTDFQELAIYDTRIKPKANDTAATARIEYLTYQQYVEHFEELFDRISWNAVDLGKFDTYWETSREKKGTATVDKDILQMIEKWRILLAEDIALHNENIDAFNLTSVVQKIIDRILFLRICEDKEIEDRNTLKKIADTKSDIYKALKSLFATANAKFNAGLFAIDEYIDSLEIQDKTLATIINELYFPKCQYEFSVLPVEILGSIYERFLGKVIRFIRKTKNGHSIEIVEKPEVKKAGGVFYTPPYIVRYIVKQTIGKKIEGKSPEQVAKMCFVDPACGSGSFLVGAYQYLLDWHLSYYLDDVDKYEKKGIIYKDAYTQDYKLSIETKRKILLNNIYGVDIDAQAVEVTKLSLFLKLLENEGRSLSSTGQVQLFRTSDINAKILPSLMNNIKCGNSLIGSDFYEEKDLSLFSVDDQRKVNTFDWEEEFSQVFKNGGFDCVIGNPPYLRVQDLRENYEEESKFYEQKYKSATGRFDFYVLFMERGFSLLNKNGILSYILPHKFINSDFGIGIRDFIYDNKALHYLVHFGAEQVFEKAKVYTCIVGLSHGNKAFDYAQLKPKEIEVDVQFGNINYKTLSDVKKWSFQDKSKATIIDKMRKQPIVLKNIIKKCSQGTVSMGDDLQVMQGHFEGKFFIGFSDRLKKEIKLEKNIMKPLLVGENVKRYAVLKNTFYEIYPHHLVKGKTVPYEENEMKTLFPLTYEYLLPFKKELKEKKVKYKTNTKYWYTLHRSRDMNMFEQPKIITAEISLGCNMTYDTGNLYHNTKCYTILFDEKHQKNVMAYLAILNSNVLWFFLSQTGYVLGGGFFCFKTKYLEPFPLPELDESSSPKLSSLAEQQLAVHKQLSSAKSDSDKKLLEQRIQILDTQINSEVYKLYGLTDEEIKIIEQK
ncbi:MAG: Eco57I restriction-modification methylase domain-containing protein [Fibrobacter sp.]|nr:Eco57I restriction-modification methylase domain-containing protein [Fibrobacter sp.]